jgi:beta-lactamase class A
MGAPFVYRGIGPVRGSIGAGRTMGTKGGAVTGSVSSTERDEPGGDAALQAALARAEAAMGGVLGLRASLLDGSDVVAYRDDDVAPAASTIKVFLLAALLADVADGRLDLEHEVELRDADRVPGTGVLKVLEASRTYPLRDLATLMIVVSDNVATNLVLDQVGLTRFQAWLGASDWPATRATGRLQVRRDAPRSTTSARDLHDALRRLWTGELLPDRETAVAREILSAQQHTDTLGREIGYDAYAAELGESPLALASKGGQLRGVRNEAAVLERGGRTVALAVTTRDCPDLRFHADNAGSLCVSRVVRLLHDRYLAPATGPAAS